MKTIILAGGYGTRISEEGQFKPKPMVDLGGMPILWHIMKLYSHHGFNEFIICAGYKQHIIKEYFADYFLHTSDITYDFTDGKSEMTIHRNTSEPWKVTVVDTGLNTMTGGRIRRVKDFIGNDPFMLTYGDGVSDLDITKLLKFHHSHKKMVTISAYNTGQRFGVLDIAKDGTICDFREKTQGDGNLINIGYMVCQPEFIKDDTILEKAPLETMAKMGQLMAYKHNGFWQCMDTAREKESLEKLWAAGQAPWKVWNASRVFDEREMCSLVDSALDFWLTTGRYAERFEQEFAAWLGVKYASLTNSGSSANLLAFSALTASELGERRIKRGDEVITVAAGFPTTVTPIIQYGAVPVFVDVTIPQYNIDATKLEDAISDKTKVVMIAHTLGNPFDLSAIKAFCDKHSLWLVEDNCDALGSTYTMEGKPYLTGTIGDIGTSSFYPSHHMTMGEGGCVYTNDSLLHKLINSYRDWGRDCACPSGHDNLCGYRFDGQYGKLPKGYDHKYVYSHFGYNLKVTEMQVLWNLWFYMEIQNSVYANYIY